ncbi:RNA polymerase subunit sigma-70 [Nocardia sp. NPDC046763]|uniref:RNA polymerase subunit sigma-70 n=1 Tax=Nocardia sp. NPDC046763 TaxID=3155256 RepID=UPI0033C1CF97
MSELLVEQARAGVGRAFEELVSPHRRELHVHCYRMLGSAEDAEDAVQETLLRAWTRVGTFAGTSTFRAWLYAVATNVCLDALRRRKRRPWPTDEFEAAEAGSMPGAPADIPWLQPYPDSLLRQASSAEDSVLAREGIQLAFLTAIQQLPPRQRAVLLLCDVLSWPAKQAATALDMTPTAVYSALRRAQATLAAREPGRADALTSSTGTDRTTLEKLVRAWESADMDGLVSLLADDARLVMPPYRTWFQGPAAIATFLASPMPDSLARAKVGNHTRLLPTAANSQPAFGLYLQSADGTCYEPFGIGVLTLGTKGIHEIAVFMLNPALFDLFDLPAAA